MQVLQGMRQCSWSFVLALIISADLVYTAVGIIICRSVGAHKVCQLVPACGSLLMQIPWYLVIRLGISVVSRCTTRHHRHALWDFAKADWPAGHEEHQAALHS